MMNWIATFTAEPFQFQWIVAEAQSLHPGANLESSIRVNEDNVPKP